MGQNEELKKEIKEINLKLDVIIKDISYLKEKKESEIKRKRINAQVKRDFPHLYRK